MALARLGRRSQTVRGGLPLWNTLDFLFARKERVRLRMIMALERSRSAAALLRSPKQQCEAVEGRDGCASRGGAPMERVEGRGRGLKRHAVVEARRKAETVSERTEGIGSFRTEIA